MVHVTSTEEFNNIITHGTSLIKIGLPSCGPCNLTQKNIESVESEFPDVHFVEINAEESEELTDALNIRNVPVVIVSKDGIETGRHAGLATVDKIRELLA